MKSYCCLLLFLLNFSLRIESANDSMILTYHQFIEQVRRFTQFISQSKLIAANGQISLLKGAKSFVDLSWPLSYETKMFKDIDYYQYKELGNEVEYKFTGIVPAQALPIIGRKYKSRIFRGIVVYLSL